MCGRYFFDPSAEVWQSMKTELKKRYGHRAEQMARGEIFPGQLAVVRANTRQLRPGWFLMRWGFHTGQNSRLIINARMETAEEKITFAESVRCRRCLIPAQRYFEWTSGKGEKQKYALEPVTEELTYLAGLYRHEKEGPAVVVLTRPAAPSVSGIHHRMPLILKGTEAEKWLAPGEISREWMEKAAVEEMCCQPVLL